MSKHLEPILFNLNSQDTILLEKNIWDLIKNYSGKRIQEDTSKYTFGKVKVELYAFKVRGYLYSKKFYNSSISDEGEKFNLSVDFLNFKKKSFVSKNLYADILKLQNSY